MEPPYRALLDTTLGVPVGEQTFVAPPRFWTDEVLMSVFFFVVGLEIRRELAQGGLTELRRAALPVSAALGGMLVPAAIQAALNLGKATARGWGIPMATDIAFGVRVLTILGGRVPPASRILLLALAILDDIGAIVVIGLFYSSSVQAHGLAIAAAGVGAVLDLQRLGAWHPVAYALPSPAVWHGLHEAGVHATLAGVVLDLLTPAKSRPGGRHSRTSRRSMRCSTCCILGWRSV